MFPFSVGEWLIVAGILVVLAAVVLGCSLLIPACRHSEKYCRGVKEYFVFFAWTLLAVFAIMTLNCTMIYHGSTFSEKYFGEEEAQEQTTQERTEELLRIYNDIVRHCNELSEVMERDDSGAVVYSGGVDSRGNAVDMEDKAIDVMQSLGKRYDQLDGYYPRPKAMFFSDFMCQMYMCGYYFPFSMEANYNDVMYIMEKPATMCHELAHIRGYTPFFAPFFMVFFGLCLGDSGYGLFLFLAATLYRMFAKNISATMKPILSLIQILAASTFFCGMLTGTFFGVSLYDINIPFLQYMKDHLFMDNNAMFQLSLILGVIQILFGMILKAVNQAIQFGFK